MVCVRVSVCNTRLTSVSHPPVLRRALGFVVEGKNNMIDKTLAFDIKLVRVDD